MSSIKYVRMRVPNASWHIQAAYSATISNRFIAEKFSAKLKSELKKRGLEESDVDVDFKRIKEYLDVTTMKLGSAKIAEFGLQDYY